MNKIDQRWEGLTVTGDLVVGVFFAGVRHKRFIMRIPMAGDLVVVQEEHPNATLHVATLATYQRQLLALGDIPTEELTYDLLRAELTESDLSVLADADEVLEKRFAQPAATGADHRTE